MSKKKYIYIKREQKKKTKMSFFMLNYILIVDTQT
jgi:hypothetical protein